MKPLLLATLLFLAGCTQIIVKKDRLQINTFLQSTKFDSFYYDPNDGFFEVGDYQAIPSNIELQYDKLTGKVKIITKANK